MPDLVLHFATFTWNGLPVASLALFTFGGLVYVAMSRVPTTSNPRHARVRRPGWIARRRARGGIIHNRGRVGVGYTSATRSVHLTSRELTGHGAVFGGPGSGKTSFLQLLVEASVGRMPVVVVDPKGSPALERTVRAHGGLVWTLDGTTPADLLDPRPWQVPDLLLEAEDYSADARAYRDAAHQRALWAAWALALQGAPMDLASLRRLLDRATLKSALVPFQQRDPRIAEWIHHLDHQHGGIEDSGARGLDRALGILLDGVAIRGSLHACPEALRLDDIAASRGLVLFKLDAAEYPHATRKVASWILLGMGRLARALTPGADGSPSSLLLVDEVGALGYSARHLRGLVGRARESGLAVVLATQGPSDLEAVDHALLPQVLQDTAWQLAFRQGSPQDADRMQAVFGQAWVEDVTRLSDGRSSTRHVERPRVGVDEWMNSLQPGDAWLRVAPVDDGWRQHRVRVAMPSRKVLSERSRAVGSETNGPHFGRGDFPTEPPLSDRPPRGPLPRPSLGGAAQPLTLSGASLPSAAKMLPSVPPTCPPELLERMGADIRSKIEERRASPRRELGPCLVWREGEPTLLNGTYGRLYDPTLKRSDAAHLVVWRRCFPDRPIPKGMTVDHLCYVTLCQRPDHLQGPVSRADNTRRRHRRPTTSQVSPSPAAATTFAIALFDRIDRPQLHAKTVALDELVRMLATFEVIDDKRRRRCWSPTKYAEGEGSRNNAGVEAVSCLVFDLDRVPPDPTRLEHVCWIGHTTWSHTEQAPRWRVVIPLAQFVPATRWADIWRRARAALCPEADPACKDPSRAYWLPSCRANAPRESTCHAGPLLDPRTLPELPVERRPRSVTRSSAPVNDHRRADAYMRKVIDNLAKAAPGGRNAALNGAAWTLGRWIAAGALEQTDVEDALYAAAERNGLVADDGQRQTWATIRSGLGKGLLEPKELER